MNHSKDLPVYRDTQDRTARSRCMDKRYYIDGSIYVGIPAIEEHIGLSASTIKKRLISKDWPDWCLLQNWNERVDVEKLTAEIEFLENTVLSLIKTVDKLCCKDRGRNSDVSKDLLILMKKLKL